MYTHTSAKFRRGSSNTSSKRTIQYNETSSTHFSSGNNSVLNSLHFQLAAYTIYTPS
jgi:hypothetical protein